MGWEIAEQMKEPGSPEWIRWAPAFQHLSDMWAPGNGVQMLIQKATLNTVTCSHTAACSIASAQE